MSGSGTEFYSEQALEDLGNTGSSCPGRKGRVPFVIHQLPFFFCLKLISPQGRCRCSCCCARCWMRAGCQCPDPWRNRGAISCSPDKGILNWAGHLAAEIESFLRQNSGKSDAFSTQGDSWTCTNLLHYLCTAAPTCPGCTQHIHYVQHVQLEGDQG